MNRIGLFIWITAIGVSSPGAVELVAPGGESGKGKGKARLFKGKKKVKVKGDPVKQYHALIQRCKEKGFKKC